VLTEQVLNDYTTAPIDEKVRATLALLEKFTLDHSRLTPDDIRAAIGAGVSRQRIADAMEVAFLFNIYDRLADAMGWDVPAQTSGYYQTAATRLLERGYRL
jgi:alkylhydroperoxidase family enzyme